MQDNLRLLLVAMGKPGNGLQVEPKVLIMHHDKDEGLPAWLDGGRGRRKLTMSLHLSSGQGRIAEGGALRLHPVAEASASGRGVVEVPGSIGCWCVYYTHKFRQEVTRVKRQEVRWSISAFAEDAALADREEKARAKYLSQSETSTVDSDDDFFEAQQCDRCGFAAGNGITLCCPGDHRICRQCLHIEIRQQGVPTCPACVKNGEESRDYWANKWDLLASASLDEIGCVCPYVGAEEKIDPGSRVIIAGQSRESNLNGKLGEAIWWSAESRAWQVLVFATGQITMVSPNCLNLADCCPPGGPLLKCPCWPSGRGIVPVSLGCRCCAKQAILTVTGDPPEGYPYGHGIDYMPFDWNLSSLDGILHFLRHNFANFFHFNNQTIMPVDGHPNVKFDKFNSSFMTFLHHDPRKDCSKIIGRMDRFRKLCTHTRETRGARPILFVRYVHETKEFARIDELYAHLRLWAGGRARLLIVSMCQTPTERPKLYRHVRLPRVLFWLCGEIGLMDFSPTRKGIRFVVLDELGLLNCETIDPDTYQFEKFRDPNTTQSHLCKDGDWLTDIKGQDPAFFPDCPRCQEPWQKRPEGAALYGVVKSAREGQVAQMLQELMPPDVNCWDAQGQRPLHRLVELEAKGVTTESTVRIAALLLLAHADPRCHDFERVSVLQHAKRTKASHEVCALLRAAAAVTVEDGTDTQALHRALDLVGEPGRSSLHRVLCVHALRHVGEGEVRWRQPDTESIIDEVETMLRRLEREPEEVRKQELKRVLLEWHPDKNSHRSDLATVVFQYIQANKDRVIRR